MAVTLTTVAKVIDEVGTFAASAITADTTAMEMWINQAEGRICAETRRDWVNNYSGLEQVVKWALEGCCTALATINVIGANASNWPSSQAQFLADVERDKANQLLNILKDFKSNEIKAP